jgi:hypothetical protein
VNTPVEPTKSKAWRVPPTHPAFLFLVVSAMAALNIYGHPSGSVRAFTLLLAAACLGLAISWLRMFLIADSEGIAVRQFRRIAEIPWSDVQRIDIVSAVRGGRTIRIVRLDGRGVDVAPSLLQPSRPTSKANVEHLLKGIVRELQQMAPAGPGSGPGTGGDPGSSRW